MEDGEGFYGKQEGGWKMVRDFSEDKRREVYRILEQIDDREWKSFMAWCGSRAEDFGDWADRLDISFYTRQIDNYQNKILQINESTRRQMEAVFESEAETDRRYAETFRAHGETVKEQIARVRVMTEAMQSAGRPGADIRAMLCSMGEREKTELEQAERCLDRCLEERGYTNAVEREFIIAMIRKDRPDLLKELYEVKSYNVSFWEIPMGKIEEYYEANREYITLEAVEEMFRKDERAEQYSVVCDYLNLLRSLHYICKADYDRYVKDMEEGSTISSEKKEEICEFMAERREFIKKFESSKIMSNGTEDERWVRNKIMCALQIEAELSALEYDREFIAGLIGNMKEEGDLGEFEKTNSPGKDGKYKYWVHINQCIDYHDRYSGKTILDADLIQLYADMVCKRKEEKPEVAKYHCFGIGLVQWTGDRGEELLTLYLREAGYDVKSDEFQKIVQDCQEERIYEKVYIKDFQVENAEMEMMVYELEEHDRYKEIYPAYEGGRGDDTAQNIKLATDMLMKEYVKPATETTREREAAALRWYEEVYDSNTEL